MKDVIPELLLEEPEPKCSTGWQGQFGHGKALASRCVAGLIMSCVEELGGQVCIKGGEVRKKGERRTETGQNQTSCWKKSLVYKVKQSLKIVKL